MFEEEEEEEEDLWPKHGEQRATEKIMKGL